MLKITKNNFNFKGDGGSSEIYCLNPKCPEPADPNNVKRSICQNCESKLLVQNRYRVIRRLGKGGFANTFEVDDKGTLKVLKVLDLERFSDPERKQKVVSLFKREAEVLSCLKHPAIPRGDGSFFTFLPRDCQEPLYCLVMEKIEGVNLKEWLEQRGNKPIATEQAIAWLKQLAEILHQVHKKDYFHRDIKPSNIMVCSDERLVLIDFGAVREATETYFQSLEGRGGTLIISPGYTPPEQANGQAVIQSDFYALGRTFVHLLTGKHPVSHSEDRQTGQLNWRASAPSVSEELADLIDDLMAPLPPYSKNRPRDAQEIWQRLEEIEARRNGDSRLTTLLSTMPATSHTARNNSTKIITILLNSGNKRRTLLLVVSAILVVGVGAVIYWITTRPAACDSTLGDSLSCGEEVLVPDSGKSFKQKGAQELANGKYSEAISLLQKARDEQPNDPETLIYLNNARLANQKAYTIAVAAPIGRSTDTGLEILRGVAQAQDEINQKKINGIGLRVLIADDGNNATQAKEIASKLAARGDILAVVGHHASEVTLAALPVYQQQKLVVISPNSTSEELSHWGNIPDHVFFRTVPTTRVAAQALASYLITQANQKTAVVFYSPQSSFSRSLREQFIISFRASGGNVVKEFDLSNPAFNASAAINQARKQGATALAVFPDGGTTTFGIPNTLRLIKANQGINWIVGDSILYNSNILELLGKDALNRFVISVPWHYLDSRLNPEFPQAARNLWRGNVSLRTATAYDAAKALIAALEKEPAPSRISLQQVLTDDKFQAEGATGVVSFQGGDRHEPISTLLKVVRDKCSPESYTYVPLNPSVTNDESLKICQN